MVVRMGLKYCKSCGAQLASNGISCPHCETKPPRSIAIIYGVIFILVFIAMLRVVLRW